MTTQQARNLLTDLGERGDRVKFMILVIDAVSQPTGAFDDLINSDDAT